MMLHRAVSLFTSIVTCSLLVPAQTAHIGSQPVQTAFACISGFVTTRDGHPIPDARVDAHDPLTGSVIASAYSRSNGSFKIEDVPLGAYELHARSGMSETRATVLLKSAGNAAAAMVKILMPSRDFSIRGMRQSDETSQTATVSVAQLKQPAKISKLVKQIRRAMYDNKNDEARKYVDQALRAEPDNSEILTFRGLLKMRSNDNEGALNDLDAAAKRDSHSALTFLGLGAVFNRLDRYDEAERALDRATTLDPSSWQAYFELAKTKLGKDEYELALGYADRAQALSPKDYAPLHLVRANALMALREFRPATTELQAYVEKDGSKDTVARAKEMLTRIRSKLKQGEATVAQSE